MNSSKLVFISLLTAISLVAAPAYSAGINANFPLENKALEGFFQHFLPVQTLFQAKSKRNATIGNSMSKPKKMKRAKKGKNGGDGAQAAEERRMMRECKGRPNSGACLGYAN